MKDIRKENGFLIICVSCVLILLMMCYFGINTNLKGTAAVDSASCPSGYTEKFEYNGKTYCGNNLLKYTEDGYICTYTTKENPSQNGYTCSDGKYNEDGEIIYECTTKDLSLCTVELTTSTSVDIPTAANYCQSGLVYDGSVKTLTMTAGTGYTFSSNTRTNAGTQEVVATLKSGYVWSDGTTGTKKFSCSIAKATPTITVSPTSLTIEEGGTGSFTIKGSVVGDYTVTSSATSKVTVSKSSYSDVAANTNQTVTVTGVSSGSSTITVAFTPKDTSNYNTASSKTVTVTVIKSDVEVAIPTAANYCQSGLVYDGSVKTLTMTAGTGYTFSSNTRTNAGTQEVVATLKSGYVWSDGTTGTKKFSCSIAKATPTITVSPTSLTIEEGGTGSFTIKGSVVGDYTVTSSATSKVTVSKSSYSDVAANTNQTVTVTGVSSGSSTITVAFTPKDTSNYNTASSKTVTVTVIKDTSGEETPIEQIFTVMFDANGGQLEEMDKQRQCSTITGECKIDDLPEPTRSGYTFKGWSLESTCTAGNKEKITLISDETYYACWQKNAIKPSVDNDGNVDENVQTGDIVIALVWFFGLCAIGYAGYYFKSLKEN